MANSLLVWTPSRRFVSIIFPTPATSLNGRPATLEVLLFSKNWFGGRGAATQTYERWIGETRFECV